MLAHHGVLRFTCGFVHRDLQRMARILLLVNEAVERAPEIGMSQAMWTIPLAHESMVRFAQRWMQPYSTFFGETRGVGKRLAPEAGTEVRDRPLSRLSFPRNFVFQEVGYKPD